MKKGILYLLVLYFLLFVIGFYLNNVEGFITGRFNNDIDLTHFDDFKFAMRNETKERRVNERCYTDSICISGRCDTTGKYGCKNKCIRREIDVSGGTPFFKDDPNSALKNCPPITQYDSGVLTFQAPGVKCQSDIGIEDTIIKKPLNSTPNTSIESRNYHSKEVGELCMENNDCESKRCDTTGAYGCRNKCIRKNKDVPGTKRTVSITEDKNAHLKNCPIGNKTLSGSLLVDSATTYTPFIKDFKGFEDPVNCFRY